MEKMLVLVGEEKAYRHMKINMVRFSNIYNRKLPICIVKVLRHTKMVFYALGNWVRDLDEYETIIVFDAMSTSSFLKWLRKKAEKKRIILFYRNCITSIRNEIHPQKVKKLGYELWSYNLHDCEKYHLNYNHQMLCRELFANRTDEIYEYDVLFLGNAKERGTLLIELQEKLSRMGLKVYFYVLNLPELKNNKCVNNMPMKYEDYIQLIYRSRAIMDIVLEENYGLTLRPLEALFSHRKLLTNYSAIKEYDFYNANNVYVLQKDLNEKNLRKFLFSEYHEVPEDIVNSYSVEAWVARF